MQLTSFHIAYTVDYLAAHRDAKKMRGSRPLLFTDLKSGRGLDDVSAVAQCRDAIVGAS
jgi:Ni2+-binding GTPase involved in maturation of urease and hydrogenase